MADNRSKVYIDANENLTETLKKIQSSVDQVSSKLAGMGKDTNTHFDKTNSLLSKSTEHLTNIGGKLGGAGMSALKMSGAFVAAEVALEAVHKVAEGVFELFHKSIEIQIETQTAKNGLAGVISLAYNLKDATGKLYEGPEKFQKALLIAGDQMDKLRVDSIKTGLSIADLNDAYKVATGPAASLKMSPDQARKFSVSAAAAGQVLGIKGESFGRDLRDLLMNGAPTVFSRELGLSGHGALAKEYEQAIKTGKAYEFLMKTFESFSEAGKAQAATLAGAINAMHDAFNAFANDGMKGITESLNKIREPMEQLFNRDTGHFTDALTPLLTFFNTIGDLVGTELVSDFEKIVEWVKEFSSYIDDDQSLINGMVGLWDITKDLLGNIVAIFADIWKAITDIAGTIFDGVNNGLDDTQQKTDGITSTMKILAGAVAAVNLVVAAMVDVINIVADAFKVVLGGAIAFVGELFASLLRAISAVASAVGKDDVAKQFQNWGDGLLAVKKTGMEMATDNNFTKAIANGDGLLGYLGNSFNKTAEAADKGADAINKAGEKVNSSYQKWKERAKQDEIERQKRAQDAANITATPAHLHESKGSGRKVHQEDTQKLGYENQLKELEKFSQREHDLITSSQKMLDLNYSQHLINIQDYYNQKDALSDKDYKTQLDYLNKEIALAEAQKSNAKNMKDGNKVDDKYNELLNKRAKLEQDYQYKHQKDAYDRIKAIKDYQNALDELNAKIEDMTKGGTSASRIVKIRVEIDNLKEKYKSDPEALKAVTGLEKLELQQNSLNDASEKFNQILQTQQTAEERLNILQQNGRIGEITALSQIGAIRQKNIDALQEQITALDSIYSESQNPAILNQIDALKNKMLELQLTVNPLADKFNGIFNDAIGGFSDDIFTKNKSLSESFKDLFKSIESNITSLISKNLSTQLFNSLFGSDGKGGQGIGGFFASLFGSGNAVGGGTASTGGGIGSLFGSMASSIGSFFGGFFADGGAITDPSKPVIVGENGPEWFYPRTSGYIANHSQISGMGGSGGGGGLVMNVYAKDAQSFNNSRQQILADYQRAMASNARRNN